MSIPVNKGYVILIVLPVRDATNTLVVRRHCCVVISEGPDAVERYYLFNMQ